MENEAFPQKEYYLKTSDVKIQSQNKMDKYVVKTPRVTQDKSKCLKAPVKLKQRTIESLPRVVVVEKIKHAKNVLSIPNQSVKEILITLKELESRTPSKDVLLETKIGHVINNLRKHDNQEVKELARKILKSWKGFYRDLRHRQPIEVRCDLKTETFRSKAKKLLSQALQIELDSPLVELLERAAYLRFNRSINNSYRKLIRTLHMKLKSDNELKKKVLENRITPDQLFDTVS